MPGMSTLIIDVEIAEEALSSNFMGSNFSAAMFDSKLGTENEN